MSTSSTETQSKTFKTDSPLTFACSDLLPCFTQCCRDVNIYLTPYDALRLRRALKMGSSDFLARHTRHFLSKRTNIPVVQLEMDPDTLYCRLVTDAGCRVYGDRPWACRMFPLDLTGTPGEFGLIAGPERCLGLMEAASATVGEWLEGQGVEPYEKMEQAFHEVMPPSFHPGKGLPASLGKLLFLAYDLDRFRDMLRDSSFLNLYEMDAQILQEALEDEEALLRLAFTYIRSQIEELGSLV